MNDRVILVTGANSGVGFYTALGLAKRGARVIACARDAARGEEAVASIRRRSGSDRVELRLADLASLDDVRRLAEGIATDHERLDVLVNNAGVVMGRRRESADGFEMTLAVNHLAPFLLTNLLLDLLRQSAPARVVNVSSRAHVGSQIDFDDLERRRAYGAMAVYGETKLMNLLFTRELARRLEGSGVTANALHPGVVRTRIGADGDVGGATGFLWRLALPLVGISPEKGAATSIYLASSPEVEGISGEYFDQCRPQKSSRASKDMVTARRLWELSAERVGLEP